MENLKSPKIKERGEASTTPWRHMGSGGKDPHSLVLGTRQRRLARFTCWLLYPQRKSARIQDVRGAASAPRPHLDPLEKKKISLSLPGLNQATISRSPIHNVVKYWLRHSGSFKHPVLWNGRGLCEGFGYVERTWWPGKLLSVSRPKASSSVHPLAPGLNALNFDVSTQSRYVIWKYPRQPHNKQYALKASVFGFNKHPNHRL